jgi:hypothetical protein
LRSARRSSPPPPRTKWTRRVPRPVLIGHAASLTQVRAPLIGRINRGEITTLAELAAEGVDTGSPAGAGDDAGAAGGPPTPAAPAPPGAGDGWGGAAAAPEPLPATVTSLAPTQLGADANTAAPAAAHAPGGERGAAAGADAAAARPESAQGQAYMQRLRLSDSFRRDSAPGSPATAPAEGDAPPVSLLDSLDNSLDV